MNFEFSKIWKPRKNSKTTQNLYYVQTPTRLFWSLDSGLMLNDRAAVQLLFLQENLLLCDSKWSFFYFNRMYGLFVSEHIWNDLPIDVAKSLCKRKQCYLSHVIQCFFSSLSKTKWHYLSLQNFDFFKFFLKYFNFISCDFIVLLNSPSVS